MKKLKTDRHIYIIIYTNLESKTKYLYKNENKNLRGCADRDLVTFMNIYWYTYLVLLSILPIKTLDPPEI